MKTHALTPEQKWALCYRKARRIVRNHRRMIPRGHEYVATWVAVGVAVVSVTASAVAAHKQAQAQKQAAAQQAQTAQDNQLPAFKPPPMPKYVPFDFAGTQKHAIEEDQMAYRRSDDDFKRRHPGTLQAEGLFEQSVLKDQKGESELMPAIQNELTRAGIAGSLQSFGSGGSDNLEAGSAGEANVARNLGLGVVQFQDRNRQNRQTSLQLAEGIFPRREFGMNGKDFALNALQDAVNQNSFNQANYQAQTGVYEKNYDINAQNQNTITQSQNAVAQANAAAEAAKTQAIANGISTVAGAYMQSRGAGVGATTPPSSAATAEQVPGVGTAYRPQYAQYPGANRWVPVGKYA
jgi:hypothetical protein